MHNDRLLIPPKPKASKKGGWASRQANLKSSQYGRPNPGQIKMKSLPGLEIPDQTNEPIGQHISQKDLADLLGLTQGRISQLDAEGVFNQTHKDGKRVFYNLKKSIRAYCSHLKGGHHITAQERLIEERTRNFEIKNAQLEGRLLDADETAREWFNTLTGIKANLMGVASRISQTLALDPKDQARVTRMIKKALYEQAQPIDNDASTRKTE